MCIKPPHGSYFIHGLNEWSTIRFIHPQISISLHKEGLKPLRDFGYILDVRRFIAAFDRDVTSKLDRGKKVFAPWIGKKFKNYTDLNELLNNTKNHNELWVNVEDIDIIGGYIVGDDRKGFEKNLKKDGYNVIRI